MAIIYTEKGYGLHAAIAAAGHSLTQLDGVWLSSDDAAVQSIIDGYSLVDATAPLVMRVKELAHEKILAFLPDWKQSNFNARMNDLNEARFARPLSDVEQAEVAVMRAAWDKAKAFREASNVHESRLRAIDSFNKLAVYDLAADWPGL
jgi:hypothetical protein